MPRLLHHISVRYLLPSTMAKNAKIKPQVKRLLCFMKRGYGRGHRVKRSKWSGFVVEAIS